MTAGPEAPLAPLGLVVLVSGSGSNLQALLDASAEPGAPFPVLAVGADRDGTGGVERAERAGIPTFVARVPDYVTRADWDLDLERLVAEHDPRPRRVRRVHEGARAGGPRRPPGRQHPPRPAAELPGGPRGARRAWRTASR